MYIDKIHLNNFRSFKNIEIHMDKRCNVIIGVNGSGKSSILDAIAISIGSYFTKISNSASLPIKKEDAHRITTEIGSVLDTQSQFPISIYAEGIIEEKKLMWMRELSGENNKTTIKNAIEIIAVGEAYQKQIRNSDINLILPIISYYGTGRLYKKKNNRKVHSKKKFSRLDGYIDALASGTNEKQLFKWFEDMSLIEIENNKKVPELEAVKDAMISCFKAGNPDVSDVGIKYSFKSTDIEISYKRGEIYEVLPLHLLSDGIRITLTMVADIASRMAKLNPQLLDSVLKKTPGIILIDEIDMHLHPSWQKHVIESLLNTFPKIQLITTTHSPIVIGNLKAEHLILLKNNQVYTVANSFGKDISNILSEIMDTKYRPEEITNTISAFYQAIDDEQFDTATQYLITLKKQLGDNDSDVIAASTTLHLEQLFNESE